MRRCVLLRPRHRSLPPLAAAAATAIAALLTSGCVRQEGAGTSVSPLSIPPEGRVRVLARRITHQPDRVHWKWSLIGERNWRGATASGTDLALAQTYPLNSTTERGGCNIWEADLSVRRTAEGALRWDAVLHGINGVTARSGGTLDPKGNGGATSPDSALRVRQDSDAVVRLPADLTVATLDGKPVTLRVAR